MSDNEAVIPFSENFSKVFAQICIPFAYFKRDCDKSCGFENFNLERCNNAFAMLFNKTCDEIIGNNIKDIFPEDYNSLRTFLIHSQNLNGDNCLESEFYFSKRNYLLTVLSPDSNDFVILFNDVSSIVKVNETYIKHKLLFESAKDILIYVKEKGRIIEANSSACAAYGYTPEEMTKLTIHDIRHPSERDVFDEQMEMADSGGIFFETVHIRKDGSSFPVEVSSKGTFINNELIRIHVIRDISERKEAEERILFLANNDPLTKLSNRRHIIEELNKLIKISNKNHSKFALLFFDIDKFKIYNDKYGHDAGDFVLKTIAKKIKQVIDKNDFAGRFGGDEFVIVRKNINDKNDIQDLVKKLFNSINEPFNYKEHQLNVKISLGISIFLQDSNELDDLINKVDSAMYSAKEFTDNSFKFYNELY